MTRFLIVTDTVEKQIEIIDKIEDIFADYYMDYEMIEKEVIRSKEIEVTCLSLCCGTFGRPFDFLDYYAEVVDFGKMPKNRVEDMKQILLFARSRRWEKTKEVAIKTVYELIKEIGIEKKIFLQCYECKHYSVDTVFDIELYGRCGKGHNDMERCKYRAAFDIKNLSEIEKAMRRLRMSEIEELEGM